MRIRPVTGIKAPKAAVVGVGIVNARSGEAITGTGAINAAAATFSGLGTRQPGGLTIPDIEFIQGVAGQTVDLNQYISESGQVWRLYSGAFPPGVGLSGAGILTYDGTSPVASSVAVVEAAPSSDWEGRAGGPSVVWAHRFENEDELLKHVTFPRNADLAAEVDETYPFQVRPHIGADAEGTYLGVMQLGATLVGELAEATLTDHSYPTGTLTPLTTTTATIELPLSAEALGIVSGQSAIKITSGNNSGIYLDVTSSPAVGTTVTFNVRSGSRQADLQSQTGLTLMHCVMADLNNPYQTVVIDEDVATAGRNWPSPTGWSESDPTNVPADAYGVVVQSDTYVGSTLYRKKDKLTVLRATYSSSTGYTTLVVRRAAAGMQINGRLEANWVNRGFPCAFPAGSVIGKDCRGGWIRPFAALRAYDNGLPYDDNAASGNVEYRTLYQNGVKVADFRTGYYGHSDYHSIWTDQNPYYPNTLPENAQSPYDGDEFFLAWNMKYSPTWADAEWPPAKAWFLDMYENEAASQIVGLTPSSDTPMWDWYHNKGDQANSELSEGDDHMPGSAWDGTCQIPLKITTGYQLGNCWEPPLNEWFSVMVHIQCGHDNDLSYLYNLGSVVDSFISRDNTPGSESMVIDCTPMPPKLGMTQTMNGTGSYFLSAQNPTGATPLTAGYFDDWKLEIENYGKFNVVSHTVSNGLARYTVEKTGAAGDWPVTNPSPGARVRLSWIDKEVSPRYNDTVIRLYKHEAGDAGWVLVSDLTHPITYNAGAFPAQNPPGWNEFQPTGYANIDDNNPPNAVTTWTRFTDVILSHATIPAPTL